MTIQKSYIYPECRSKVNSCSVHLKTLVRVLETFHLIYREALIVQ